MTVIINGSNNATAGGVTYGDGSQYVTTAAGTAGQVLTSAGSSAPTWETPSVTNPAGSTGQLQYNDASAFGAVASGTSGQVLTSAGSGAVPTWTTITSGGMTLLASVTPANGVSSVNITGLASSRQIQVISSATVTLNASASVRLKLSVDNGISFPGSTIQFSSGNINPDPCAATIYNTAINGSKRVLTFIGGSANFSNESNATINAGTINAIQISTSTSSFTGDATFFIYGLN